MSQLINASIQIVPKCATDNFYQSIDAAIRVIQASGLKHIVTAMETVVEGSYEEVMEVFKQAQQASLDYGAEELAVNIRLHQRKQGEVSFEEKTAAYQS